MYSTVRLAGHERVDSGFTLIELLVVIALLAILLALAAPSFSALRTNQRLAAAANDLFASTLQARSEALRLNRRVTVSPLVATNWLSGWRVYVDRDNNAAFDQDTDTLVVVTPGEFGDFSVSGRNNKVPPTGFSFDARGFLVGGDNDTVVFKSPATGREKHVVVAPTGRVRFCDPKLQPGCDAAS